MYICDECGLVFNEPARWTEDRTPYGGPAEPGFQEEMSGCPRCQGNYTEAMLCPRCEDKYISTESRYPFCDGCQKDLVKELVDTFRPDEWDFLYDYTDCKSYEDLRKEAE